MNIEIKMDKTQIIKEGSHMTSEKQLIANRQNAMKSTGPQSVEGKIIVSKNATRHGILSKEVPFDEDEKMELDELYLSLHDQFKPDGEYERLLVDRMVKRDWMHEKQNKSFSVRRQLNHYKFSRLNKRLVRGGVLKLVW